MCVLRQDRLGGLIREYIQVECDDTVSRRSQTPVLSWLPEPGVSIRIRDDLKQLQGCWVDATEG